MLDFFERLGWVLFIVSGIFAAGPGLVFVLFRAAVLGIASGNQIIEREKRVNP